MVDNANDRVVALRDGKQLRMLRQHLNGSEMNGPVFNQALSIMLDGLVKPDHQGKDSLQLAETVKLNTLMYALGRDNVQRIAIAADPENRRRLTTLAQHLLEYEKVDAKLAHADLLKNIADGKFPDSAAPANRPSAVAVLGKAGYARNKLG